MSDWISVEDRLPEDRTSVLIHDRRHTHTLGGPLFVVFWMENVRGDMKWQGHLEVTHWQPLPSPPK